VAKCRNSNWAKWRLRSTRRSERGILKKIRIPDSSIHRKLAAILSADVHGYSRLMGDDEVFTVKTITAYRQIIRALIEDRRGRVVDSPGDNLLAEFGSAVDAVECAVKIQDAIEGRNAALPEKRKMIFRIGINIGDVIVKEGAIYGDGVNIASRLEGLAKPGGVCISGTSYDQVKRKLQYAYDFVGLQHVKNIEEPIRAYHIRWGDDAKGKRDGLEDISGRKKGGSGKKPFVRNVLITCFLMLLLMPVVNHFKLNLLTKMWQCRLKLIPNSQEVVVVTIGPDEHRKMNVKKGREVPPSFQEDPKAWRSYHATVIQYLIKMRAGSLGFDFWFSPAHGEQEKKATAVFVNELKLAKERHFPIIVGQYRNARDQEIYQEVAWGFISVFRDLDWLKKVMYLRSWDRMEVSRLPVESPAFFVQALAAKLRLAPSIDSGGVHLIGKPVPERLWLAFAETPFKRIPYHEIYNGWVEEKVFSDKIVLLGLCLEDTDYFCTPYSPTDFTPDNKDDSYGMPGVFLFAHAINQVLNGIYYTEINDEWHGFVGSKPHWAMSLVILVILVETWVTCLLLQLVSVTAKKIHKERFQYIMMAGVLLVMIGALAVTPVLFGLVNFLCAALLFVIVSEFRYWLRRKK